MLPEVIAMKQQQKQWMNERKIDIERQNMPDLSSADLVNALTDKITSKMPRNQKNIEKGVANEIETNTCSICFELMLPKLHSPILLFPCGHTFCKECIEHNFKTNGKKCPWCREKVASHAVNLSLQNIIVAFAKENTVKQVEIEKPSGEYESQLEMFELRCNILKQERENNVSEIKDIEKKIESEEVTVRELKKEERRILDKLEAVEKELDLVREHVKKSQNCVEKLYKDAEYKQKTIDLIDETIVPVEREKKRIMAILEIKKNN